MSLGAQGSGKQWFRVGAVGAYYGSQCREGAPGSQEGAGSEATSTRGDACGTRRSKCSVELEVEGGSFRLGQIMGSGTRGSAVYPGNGIDRLWTC